MVTHQDQLALQNIGTQYHPSFWPGRSSTEAYGNSPIAFQTARSSLHDHELAYLQQVAYQPRYDVLMSPTNVADYANRDVAFENRPTTTLMANAPVLGANKNLENRPKTLTTKAADMSDGIGTLALLPFGSSSSASLEPKDFMSPAALKAFTANQDIRYSPQVAPAHNREFDAEQSNNWGDISQKDLWALHNRPQYSNLSVAELEATLGELDKASLRNPKLANEPQPARQKRIASELVELAVKHPNATRDQLQALYLSMSDPHHPHYAHHTTNRTQVASASHGHTNFTR